MFARFSRCTLHVWINSKEAMNSTLSKILFQNWTYWAKVCLWLSNGWQQIHNFSLLHCRMEYLDKEVYTNNPTAAYFMQFNTTSRWRFMFFSWTFIIKRCFTDGLAHTGINVIISLRMACRHLLIECNQGDGLKTRTLFSQSIEV